tara:strand:- start:4 stop:309 length:306 start_codon:yes stop_codon:yes gene_type:complete
MYGFKELMRRSASAFFDASFFEPYGFSGSDSPLCCVRGESGKTDWFRRRVPQNKETFHWPDKGHFEWNQPLDCKWAWEGVRIFGKCCKQWGYGGLSASNYR